MAKAPPEVDALGEVLAAISKLDDKQRSWVIASAISNLNISAATLTPSLPAATAAAFAGIASTPSGHTPVGQPALPGTPGTKEHAKAFLRAKAPQTDVLRVACLAYYLANFKDTPEFKTLDITSMNTEAAGATFSNASKSVNNANRAHYLALAGKGKKQLAAFGEDIVNALPDMERVATLERERPKKRKPHRKAPG